MNCWYQLLIVFALVNGENFNLIFPKDGDIMLMDCKTIGICNTKVMFYGHMVVPLFHSEQLAMTIHVNSELLVTKLFESTVDFLSWDLFLDMAKYNPPYIPMSISVLNSKNTTIYSSMRNLVPTYAEDFGNHVPLERISCPLQDTYCSIDFIEIGTNNFDTCVQIAHESYEIAHKSVYNGISIDPIWMYLHDLPNVPNTLKLTAAITSQDMTAKMTTIYYLPPSLIKAYSLTQNLQGCAMIEKIHPTMKQILSYNNIPLSLVQRDHVPALSVAALLDRYVGVGRSVNLVKLDMEGLDQVIVSDLLDYYDSLHIQHLSASQPLERDTAEECVSGSGSGRCASEQAMKSPLPLPPAHPARRPCVIFFESNAWSQGDNARPDLQHRLLSLGYKSLHSPAVAEHQNTCVINCNCSSHELRRAVHLLLPTVILNHEVSQLCEAH